MLKTANLKYLSLVRIMLCVTSTFLNCVIFVLHFDLHSSYFCFPDHMLIRVIYHGIGSTYTIKGRVTSRSLIVI